MPRFLVLISLAAMLFRRCLFGSARLAVGIFSRFVRCGSGRIGTLFVFGCLGVLWRWSLVVSTLPHGRPLASVALPLRALSLPDRWVRVVSLALGLCGLALRLLVRPR